MTTESIRITPLRERAARIEAADFVSAYIPHVERHRVPSDSDSDDHQIVQTFLAHYTGTDLPKDIWLGAWDDGTLVGVLHAGAHVGQASTVSQRIAVGDPQAGSPGWLDQYVRRCVNVDEVAVAPERQNQGIGGRLLARMHGLLENDRTRDARHITTHACSASAIATFRSAGYTIGPPSTPVPPTYAEGLRTIWNSDYDVLGGSHAYRHIGERRRDGASFFQPGAGRLMSTPRW